RLLGRGRPPPRAPPGARLMAAAGPTVPPQGVELDLVTPRASGRVMSAGAGRPRRLASTALWYLLLLLVAIITVFPFLWILLTSLKGPDDLLFSTPPQFLPKAPTL